METFARGFGVAMIAIGVFLAIFYGVYIKRRDTGPGVDTPWKRISLYEAIGIGAMLIGVGLIVLIFVP